MDEAMVEKGLLGVGIYCAIGLGVALAFLLLGIARADASAKGSRWTFKLTILPGLVLLWPVILVRWASGYQVNKNIHEGDGS